MMKRLYAALVDGFGPEVGRELFEAANRSLERAAKEDAREERAQVDLQCRLTGPARFTK